MEYSQFPVLELFLPKNRMLFFSGVKLMQYNIWLGNIEMTH